VAGAGGLIARFAFGCTQLAPLKITHGRGYAGPAIGLLIVMVQRLFAALHRLPRRLLDLDPVIAPAGAIGAVKGLPSRRQFV
jgi:hypothetical protein